MLVNFSGENTYNKFLNQSGTSSVPVYKTDTQNQTQQIASVRVGDTDKQNKKGKKIFGIVGLSVGSAALLTIIGLFTLSKGFSAGFVKRIEKLTTKIKDTIAELSSKNKELTTSQKIKLKITKTIEPVAERMEACANITAMKDSALNKVLKKLKLQNVLNATNKFYKDKIVLTTKNNAYKKAELAVVDFCNQLEQLAKKENKPGLQTKAKQIMSVYNENFSVKAHVTRTNKNWEQMNGLSDKVFDKLFKFEGTKKEKGQKFLKSIKDMRTYVTTDMTAKQRANLKSTLDSTQAGFVDTMKSALELVSQKDSVTLQKLFNKADKRLSNAIASEIKSFNKLAEIQVGSVATDILGIIVPSAIATGMIVDSDNKKERIGTTLTKGIPIFGGLGASYYGATRGFTGTKNIALGLSTALLLNIIGTKTNEWYKQYADKQQLLKKTFEAFTSLQSDRTAENND